MSVKHMEKWVYVGRNRLVGGKLGYTYLRLNEDGSAPDDEKAEKHFEKPLDRWAQVGAVYAVTYTEKPEGGTSVTMGGDDKPTYQYKYGDEGKVAEWEARSVAEEGIHQAAKDQKKDFAQKEIDKALLPIRKAMAHTNYMGQRILVARVLQSLYKPVTRDDE